jgi:signal transduction histidine kinase
MPSARDLAPAGGPEAKVFGGAVLVITVLLVWWGVFASRLIDEREHIAAQLARATLSDSAAVERERTAAEQRVGRQKVMLASEGSVFGAMLLVCTGTLFMVARRRRHAALRLVRLLQFTTHELKTPIAGMRALLQSLQIGSIPADRQGKFLEQGLLECNRLEHLAETILAFQRAASQSRLRPVRTSINDLIVDVLAHRKSTFGADEVVRTASAAADILVDKDAFRVVLENLLDNARKYGGGRVEMSEHVRNGRWRLSLLDQGVGFQPSESERLFEPFERDTVEGVVHGSGLGLSISRQLVRDMGGELSAHSDGKGKGSVFTVELPAIEVGHG